MWFVVVWRLLFVGCVALFVAKRLLSWLSVDGSCLLLVVCPLLLVVCWLLIEGCCLLVVVCWLFVVCYWLLDVCCCDV